MTLQEIIKNYKKKSWLRLCTLHQIDKWALINTIKEPVYSSKHFIIPELELTTQTCFKCGTKLQLGIYKGSFTASVNCGCAKDSTQLMTLDKLSCVFTADQAALAMRKVNLAKCKGLANTIEYWRNKGMDENDAVSAVKVVQATRSNKSPSSKKGARGYSIRTIEYWLTRGFTREEAKVKIKEVQTTNGLAYYINKYGEEGTNLFIQRIEQWLNADGNKKMVAGRSKKSLILFEQLGCGFYGPLEKTVRGATKVHRVDFLFNKKIIEYFGDYWHGNPLKYSSVDKVRKKTVSDIWAHDKNKINDLINNGYEVLVIWENDYVSNPELVTTRCKEFLNDYRTNN